MCHCLLVANKVQNELIFRVWCDFGEVCTHSLAFLAGNSPFWGWSIDYVEARAIMIDPASRAQLVYFWNCRERKTYRVMREGNHHTNFPKGGVWGGGMHFLGVLDPLAFSRQTLFISQPFFKRNTYPVRDFWWFLLVGWSESDSLLGERSRKCVYATN